jgi:hypothetical protein
MAVSKVLSSTSLAIEVENGVNGSGKVVYKKKNFSGVKINAAPENVFDVAEAIKGVLSNPARDYLLNETSKISNV